MLKEENSWSLSDWGGEKKSHLISFSSFVSPCWLDSKRLAAVPQVSYWGLWVRCHAPDLAHFNREWSWDCDWAAGFPTPRRCYRDLRGGIPDWEEAGSVWFGVRIHKQCAALIALTCSLHPVWKPRWIRTPESRWLHTRERVLPR